MFRTTQDLFPCIRIVLDRDHKDTTMAKVRTRTVKKMGGFGVF